MPIHLRAHISVFSAISLGVLLGLPCTGLVFPASAQTSPGQAPPAAPGAGDASALIAAGDVYFDDGLYDRALTKFLEASKADPANLVARLRLAKVYAELGDRAAGLEALGAIYAAKPELKDNDELKALKARLEALPATKPTSGGGQSAAPNDPTRAERTTTVAVAARAAVLELRKLKDANSVTARAAIYEQAWQHLRPALAEVDIDNLEAWLAASAIAAGRGDKTLAAVAYEALMRLVPNPASDNGVLTALAELRKLGAADAMEATRTARARVLEELPKARAGDAAAMKVVLGAYAEGRGVMQDLAIARRWRDRLPEGERKKAWQDAVIAPVALPLLAEATEVLATVDNAEKQASVLTAIAKAYAKAGDAAMARGSFRVAIGKAATITNMTDRAYALLTIAKAQARTGDIDGATTAAANITARTYYLSALTAIIDALIKRGDFMNAKVTSSMINDSSRQSRELIKIVDAQARIGDLEGTQTTAAMITEDDYKKQSLRYIAAVNARTGDANAAKAIAAQLKAARDQAEVLAAIAEAQAQAGDVAGAGESLRAAKFMTAGIENTQDKARTLIWIAQAQASTGDVAGAGESLRVAKATALAIENAHWKADTLAMIAASQARAGDLAAAIESFRAATATTEAIRNTLDQANTLSSIVDVQARAGDLEGARTTAGVISDDFLKDRSLKLVAEAQAQAGKLQAAKATATAIRDPLTCSDALWSIAVLRAGAGDVMETRVLADTINQQNLLADTSWIIATALTNAGDLSGAQAVAAASNSAPCDRATVLLAIGEAIINSGISDPQQ